MPVCTRWASLVAENGHVHTLDGSLSLDEHANAIEGLCVPSKKENKRKANGGHSPRLDPSTRVMVSTDLTCSAVPFFTPSGMSELMEQFDLEEANRDADSQRSSIDMSVAQSISTQSVASYKTCDTAMSLSLAVEALRSRSSSPISSVVSYSGSEPDSVFNAHDNRLPPSVNGPTTRATIEDFINRRNADYDLRMIGGHEWKVDRCRLAEESLWFQDVFTAPFEDDLIIQFDDCLQRECSMSSCQWYYVEAFVYWLYNEPYADVMAMVVNTRAAIDRIYAQNDMNAGRDKEVDRSSYRAKITLGDHAEMHHIAMRYRVPSLYRDSVRAFKKLLTTYEKKSIRTALIEIEREHQIVFYNPDNGSKSQLKSYIGKKLEHWTHGCLDKDAKTQSILETVNELLMEHEADYEADETGSETYSDGEDGDEDIDEEDEILS